MSMQNALAQKPKGRQSKSSSSCKEKARLLNLVFRWQREEMLLGKSSPQLQEVVASLRQCHFHPQRGAKFFQAKFHLRDMACTCHTIREHKNE
jgi:hypothetical protein